MKRDFGRYAVEMAVGVLLLCISVPLLMSMLRVTATVQWSSRSLAPVAEGVILRQERIIEVPAELGIHSPEGLRMAAGEKLLCRNTSSAEELEVQLLRSQQVNGAFSAPRRKEILLQLTTTLQGGTPKEKQSVLEQLYGCSTERPEALSRQIVLAEAKCLSAATETEYTMPEEGVLYPWADGYEEVTPSYFLAATELPEPETVGERDARLITDDKWQLWLMVPEGILQNDEKRIRVQLLRGTCPELTMAVRWKRHVDGALWVMLETDEAMAEIAGERTISVKFLSESKSALEIPAKGIYTRDAQSYVACVSGIRRKEKEVTVLTMVGDRALVLWSPEVPDGLQPGDEILLINGNGG